MHDTLLCQCCPKRTELMDMETVDMVLDLIRREAIHMLDSTGGALD